MRILVTGGTGFVGSAIAQKYLEMGATVLVTGTKTENDLAGAKILECHFHGINYLRPALRQKFDIVFHQAANNDTLETDYDEMLEANYFGPVDFLSYLAEQGCRQFVYASSTAVYGNGPAPYSENQEPQPLNPYAKSKLYFEQKGVPSLALIYPDARFVGLRYCNVYGPGECHKKRRSSMIRQILVDMLQGRSPKLFKFGEQKRDWVYIKDVVEANVKAASYTASGIFNCGFGKAVSFNEIVEAANAILHSAVKPEYVENPYQEFYQTHTECNMKKAEDFLGFVPRFDIHTALKEYVPYLRERYFSHHSE